MSDDRGRSTLTRFAPLMRDPDPQGPRRAAKALWHEKGIITVFPGDCEKLDMEYFQAVAERLYGRRGS